ncbi:MAG: sodium-dependent transporter [Cyclobacteriaceae bacterium]
MESNKPQYTSGLATILTMVGVAVGLGNVWRFPYMMGSYGGSAFLAIYLLFTILFAYPALMAEMALGRMSGKGTLDAFRNILGKNAGSLVGYLLLSVVTIAGSYYAVVVANVIFTTGYSVIQGFNQGSTDHFQGLLSNVSIQYGLSIIMIISSLYVIHKGLVKGIEWLSKIIMPFFVLSLLYMIFHALTLPGAIDKFATFLKPNLDALNSTEVFAALGQAFFSVGLGGTFVLVYAGFMKKEESIPKMAFFTGLGDVGASLLVSLFLVPSILVFGLDMASGPGLIFNTFPQLFGTMPGGRWIGSLFLIALSLVAFLSLIAAYQVPFVSVLNEKPHLSQKKILVIIGVIQATLAFPSAFHPDLIGVLDLIFGSGMQVLGSVLCILGLTWGVKKSTVLDGMFSSTTKNVTTSLLYFWIKWVIPMALVAVLLGYIYDSIS